MRILIGIPSTEDVKADFAMALATMMGATCAQVQSVQVAVFNAKGCHVDRNRYWIVKKAQEMEADKILFIDSDMVFPPKTLLQLLSHREYIVGVNAVKRTPPHDALAVGLDGELIDTKADGLVEVSRMGTGIMLVDMKVFTDVKAPWFVNTYVEGKFDSGDYKFCQEVKAQGYNIFCDTELSLQVGHIGSTTHFPKNGEDDAPDND